MTAGTRTWTEENRLFLSVCCGYALYRLCSELACMLPVQSYEAIELGKVTGLATALLVAYRLNRGRNRALWSRLPCTLVLASCVLNVMSLGPGLGDIGALRVAGSFLMGCGTSSAMIQWLEYCGLLPCRKMVLAIAVAYLLNSAVALLAGQLDNPYLTCVLMFACALGIVRLRTICERDDGIAARLADARREVSGMARDLVPSDVLVWIFVTGLAFGLVELNGSTIIGSPADSIGRALPCAVVLIGYTVFNDRFDLRFLYSSVLPLIVASLVLVGYGQTGTFVSGLFFSMGAAALRIITYALVCVRAYQMRVSAFFGCACVMLSNVCAHAAGRAVMAVPLVQDNYTVAASLLVVLSVTVIVFLIMSESERMAYVDDLPGFRASPTDESVAELAAQRGLTPRETSVLVQMAHGKTNAEIADVLFITTGAVRSHTSRIYQKFGVGTREELDEAVRRAK